MADWIRTDGKGVILLLHIQPGAKKTEIVGRHGEALKWSFKRMIRWVGGQTVVLQQLLPSVTKR